MLLPQMGCGDIERLQAESGHGWVRPPKVVVVVLAAVGNIAAAALGVSNSA